MTTRALVTLMMLLPPLEAGAQAPAAAPAAGAKEAAIRRLLEVTGAGQMGVQVMDGLLGSFKKASPAVPDSFWAEFRSEVRAEDLLDLCVPIYAKHFSEEDVRAVIAFYETPAGKRLVKAQPLIMQESMQAGQEWGRTLAQKVIARLKEKGYQK